MQGADDSGFENSSLPFEQSCASLPAPASPGKTRIMWRSTLHAQERAKGNNITQMNPQTWLQARIGLGILCQCLCACRWMGSVRFGL